MDASGRIIINDRCLRGPLTGVGHYVAELLARMPREAPDLEVFGFYSGWRTGRPPTPRRPADRPSRPARRPPWLIRRTALTLYNAAFRIAGTLKGCTLYHEPNHIPASWRGPIVTTVHDLSVLRHPEWHPADRVRWYEKDFSAGLARTTHFITVSQFSKREMTQVLHVPADRITVIGLGVREVFRPRPTQEIHDRLTRLGLPSDYFLYAGTLEPRKNVTGLLAAYAMLPAGIRQRTALILAGVTGWGRQAVEEWIAGHHLNGRVRVLGYVQDETLAFLYAGARALVWPTLYEGFGLPPLECMACGTPVITSNLASLPEVTGEAALLVDPRDENELTHAMSRIAEDADLTARLRAVGLTRSAAFSWPDCVRAHAEVYRQTLNACAALPSHTSHPPKSTGGR